MLLLHHALFAPAHTEHTGDLFSWGMRDPHTLNLSPAVRFETWRSRWDLHPHSSRRQRVAFLFSYGSLLNAEFGTRNVECRSRQSLGKFRTPHSQLGLVGGAGNAPVVPSDVIFFDTGFTDRQSG